jgi:hypothetical protein
MANQRTKMLVEDLERTLLEFICKHGITHDEYRAATNVLVATVKAGEESWARADFARPVGAGGWPGKSGGPTRRP